MSAIQSGGRVKEAGDRTETLRGKKAADLDSRTSKDRLFHLRDPRPTTRRVLFVVILPRSTTDQSTGEYSAQRDVLSTEPHQFRIAQTMPKPYPGGQLLFRKRKVKLSHDRPPRVSSPNPLQHQLKPSHRPASLHQRRLLMHFRLLSRPVYLDRFPLRVDQPRQFHAIRDPKLQLCPQVW